MSTHFCIVKSAALSGAECFGSLEAARAQAEAEALRDGLPHLVVEVHGVANRKLVTGFDPVAPETRMQPAPPLVASMGLPCRDSEVMPPDVADMIDSLHRRGLHAVNEGDF